VLQGFSNRFTDLLRAVDEIAFQYYLEPNNDTLDAMAYHLNYFVTLVTGIFDSLARLSVIRYDLKINGVDFERKIGLTKITLRKPTKQNFPFLEQLLTRNPELSKFISNEQNFIELFYPLREKIVHRERLQQTRFEYHGDTGDWKANFVEIPKDVEANINQFDKKQEHDLVTKWGIYRLGGQVLLEPFHFVKASTEKLALFCNRYFDMLGFNGSLETHSELKQEMEESKKSKTHMVFQKELEIFEKCHLGF
jgi:hypothetical protein